MEFTPEGSGDFSITEQTEQRFLMPVQNCLPFEPHGIGWVSFVDTAQTSRPGTEVQADVIIVINVKYPWESSRRRIANHRHRKVWMRAGYPLSKFEAPVIGPMPGSTVAPVRVLRLTI